MRVGTMFGLSLSAVAAAALGWVLVPGCTPTETAGPGGVDSGGVSDAGYCGSPGAACCAGAGQFPDPQCDDGNEKQCAASANPVCSIASMCGSTTTCEPLATNTGGIDNFRMRRLIVAAPTALANPAAQNAVVTNAIDMNEPQCQELGTGDFNWLLSFNMNAMTLTTGGAPACDLTDTVAANGFPACNPYTTGYCFVNKLVPGSKPIQVAPATVPIAQAADGTWGTSTTIPVLNIPIYFGVPPAIIVLPISGGSIKGVTISPDGNCIGSVNPAALAAPAAGSPMPNACSDNYQACSKWKTDGSLAGYITLEVADTVNVALLNQTLCSLLTGDTGGTAPNGAHACTKVNGVIQDKGDFCSTTAAPGGCADSYWLAATFSASAVKIDTTGTSNPDCMGGGDSGTPAVDSGSDSGSAADSGAGDAAGD